MDVDEPSQRSYTPQASTPAPATSSGRRGPRGPYKKHAPAPEKTVDEDGRLPGAKDGLAAFPPGSDWAKVMLQLKLKSEYMRFRFVAYADRTYRQEVSDKERADARREGGSPRSTRR